MNPKNLRQVARLAVDSGAPFLSRSTEIEIALEDFSATMPLDETDCLLSRKLPVFLLLSRREQDAHPCLFAFRGGKIWIEPEIELAVSKGLNSRELKEVETQIKEKENEIREEWNKHFGSTQ